MREAALDVLLGLLNLPARSDVPKQVACIVNKRTIPRFAAPGCAYSKYGAALMHDCYRAVVLCSGNRYACVWSLNRCVYAMAIAGGVLFVVTFVSEMLHRRGGLWFRVWSRLLCLVCTVRALRHYLDYCCILVRLEYACSVSCLSL